MDVLWQALARVQTSAYPKVLLMVQDFRLSASVSVTSGIVGDNDNHNDNHNDNDNDNDNLSRDFVSNSDPSVVQPVP
jgi:hypothetical protein